MIWKILFLSAILLLQTATFGSFNQTVSAVEPVADITNKWTGSFKFIGNDGYQDVCSIKGNMHLTIKQIGSTISGKWSLTDLQITTLEKVPGLSCDRLLDATSGLLGGSVDGSEIELILDKHGKKQTMPGTFSESKISLSLNDQSTGVKFSVTLKPTNGEDKEEYWTARLKTHLVNQSQIKLEGLSYDLKKDVREDLQITVKITDDKYVYVTKAFLLTTVKVTLTSQNTNCIGESTQPQSIQLTSDFNASTKTVFVKGDAAIVVDHTIELKCLFKDFDGTIKNIDQVTIITLKHNLSPLTDTGFSFQLGQKPMPKPKTIQTSEGKLSYSICVKEGKELCDISLDPDSLQECDPYGDLSKLIQCYDKILKDDSCNVPVILAKTDVLIVGRGYGDAIVILKDAIKCSDDFRLQDQLDYIKKKLESKPIPIVDMFTIDERMEMGEKILKNNRWEPITPDTMIEQDDCIKTSAGRVLIALKVDPTENRSINVSLAQDTETCFKTLDKIRKELELLRGLMLLKINEPLNSKALMEIYTKENLHVIKGSEIIISYDPTTKESTLYILEGEVTSTNLLTDETVEFTDGQKIMVENGEFTQVLTLSDAEWDSLVDEFEFSSTPSVCKFGEVLENGQCVPITITGITIDTNKETFAGGDTVILTGIVGDGNEGDLVALEVKDPSGETMLIRTVSLGPDASFELQFKIPTSGEAGSYDIIANAEVGGETVTETKTISKSSAVCGVNEVLENGKCVPTPVDLVYLIIIGVAAAAAVVGAFVFLKKKKGGISKQKTPKFCNKCGTPVAPSNKFCKKCGNVIIKTI